MISVAEALQKISANINFFRRSEVVALEKAAGYVVSADVFSLTDQPPFNQSAVDGYAVNTADGLKGPWKLTGEMKAGDAEKIRLSKGEAVRIFTGALVPAGADTVIMQEHIERENEIVSSAAIVVQGQNIRLKGSQIEKGQLAITAGTYLNPASIGFLANLGINKVEVFSKPLINLIVTGDELVKPGEILGEGQIFESNSITVKTFLETNGHKLSVTRTAADDQEVLREAVRELLQHADILILTGGISVGDYDFVKSILEEEGTKEIFYKVKQKPGKPLYFGIAGKTLVFALPGNPAAVLTCLYEYVYPALNLFCGRKDAFLKKIKLPVLHEYKKKPGLVNFLKGKLQSEGVMPLEGQESYIMKSFGVADCLIYLPEETGYLEKGTMVEVHLLPFWN